MLHKKPYLALFLAIVTGALMLQSPAAEAATIASPPTQAEQTIAALLEKFAVPPQQRLALLAEAAAGEAWDVYRPDAVPVRADTLTIDGLDYVIDRYADGSFSAVGVEVPAEASHGVTGEGDPAITQCRYTTGSGYHSVTGCQIDGVWGTVIIGAIDVGYTLVDGGLDRMTDYGYGYQQCLIPTTCSSPNLVLSQDVEGSIAAHGRWQADVTSPWGSWNVWVQLNVGDDSAWQSNS